MAEHRSQVDDRALRAQARYPAPQAGPYGALRAPPAGDIESLRRQQAEFRGVTRDISRQNSWMAVPALAPAAAILALEGGAALTARTAAAAAQRTPLVFPEKLPYLRVGDNWATRLGRRAHRDFAEQVAAKPGWEAEKTIIVDGKRYRPDALTPARASRNGERFALDRKPDTPSGRRAGAASEKKYLDGLGIRTRAVYYDPKTYK